MAKSKSEVASVRSGTIILSCSCAHAFQDNLYGKNKRVHNAGPNNKKTCTVCGSNR